MKKEDAVQIRITATQPLQETPIGSNFPETLTVHPLKTAVFAMVFSRFVYIFLAEQKMISAKTLEHYVVVFIPTCISLFHFLGLTKSGWVGFITNFIQILLFFGLGWNIPAIFMSQRDTLSNFLFFMCFQRVYCSFTRLHAAYKKGAVDEQFINACIVIIPIIPWFICYLQSVGSIFYLVYVLGVGFDVICAIAMEWIDLAYRKTVSNNNELQQCTQILFGILGLFYFEVRVLGEYPENIAGVSFQLVNFVVGCIGLFCLYCMYELYAMATKREVNQVKRSLLWKWIHVLIIGSMIGTVAGMHLISMSIYYPTSTVVGLPMNLSIPPSDLFKSNILLNSTGAEYLELLTNLYIESTKVGVSGPYSSLLAVGVGTYLISVSLLAYIALESSQKGKLLNASTFAIGLLGILLGSFLNNINISLLVLPITATVILSLVVLGKFYLSRH